MDKLDLSKSKPSDKLLYHKSCKIVYKMEENICKPDKELVFIIYKELSQVNKNQTPQLKTRKSIFLQRRYMNGQQT